MILSRHKKGSFSRFLKAGTGLTFAAFMYTYMPSKSCASSLFFEDDAMVPSYSDFGDVGLLQMPNARMMPDGEMGIGSGYVDPYRRHFINFQMLPWLGGTFRYTSVSGVPYNQYRDNQNYKDKSIDIKFRLLKEREYFPETSIGLRDIGGTGLFQSEYIAFSKRYLNLDMSFGLGFGNMGTRGQISNPFSSIFGKSFEKRKNKNGTGALSNAFFKGEKASFFGGIEYQTAYKPVRIKLEYDGNNYTEEPFLNDYIKSESPINYGIQYSPFSWLDITGSYERGDKVMLRANLRTNFNDVEPIPKFDEIPAPALKVRDMGTVQVNYKQDAVNHQKTVQNKPQEIININYKKIDYGADVNGLFDIVESNGLEVRDIIFDDNSVKIYVSLLNSISPSSGDMIIAANKIFNLGFIENLEKVTFVAIGANNKEVEAVYNKKDLERSINLTGTPVALAPPLPISWTVNLLEGFENKEQDFTELLFSTLEEQGIVVSEVSIENKKVTVYVDSYSSYIGTANYEIIASNLKRGFGSDLSEISFVERNNKGKELRKVTKNIAPYGKFFDTKYDENAVTEEKKKLSKADIKKIAEKVFKDLAKINFRGHSFDIVERKAILAFSQNTFRNQALAIGRAARAVANNLPPQIEMISLIIMKDGLATTKTTIFRKDLELAFLSKGSPEEVLFNADFEAAKPLESETAAYNKLTPKVKFGFEPKLRQHIGGGDNFYFWQVYGKASANIDVTDNWSLSGSFGFNIANNFDKMEVKNSDSVLPHVRSDITSYIKGSNHWLDSLNTSYITNLTPNWYARASAGVFEMMYVGVGGEVLYRPMDKNYAIGLDVNRVRQRDYSGYFGLLSYQTTTGHLSFYNKLPFYNIETVVRIGKYLAKDFGATLEVSRKFKSGVELGVFATKTDVSSEEFGEGSFDKGVYMTIPFDLFSTKSTAAAGSFSWRPLTRDGGQMLDKPKSLYGVTSNASKADITKGWSDILK